MCTRWANCRDAASCVNQKNGGWRPSRELHSLGLEYIQHPPPEYTSPRRSGAWIKVDLRLARAGGEWGFITLIAMPTTHNEAHYGADVVRLRWLKRHEQPYRSGMREERCLVTGGGGSSGGVGKKMQMRKSEKGGKFIPLEEWGASETKSSQRRGTVKQTKGNICIPVGAWAAAEQLSVIKAFDSPWQRYSSILLWPHQCLDWNSKQARVSCRALTGVCVLLPLELPIIIMKTGEKRERRRTSSFRPFPAAPLVLFDISTRVESFFFFDMCSDLYGCRTEDAKILTSVTAPWR